MPLKTMPFNPFDYMDNQEEMNVFLIECFQDPDPQVFVSALGHLVKKHGVADVAKATGVSRESLYKSFNGTTQPRWDTIHRVMTALKVDVTQAA